MARSRVTNENQTRESHAHLTSWAQVAQGLRAARPPRPHHHLNHSTPAKRLKRHSEMDTMKIKTSELTGPALYWAVAKVEKHQPRCEWMLEKEGFHAWQSYERAWGTPIPLYSSDWAQGGPIVNNNPRIVPTYDERFDSWFAYKQSPALYGKQDFLVSAMRAYVANKLDTEIEIPDNLLKEINAS